MEIGKIQGLLWRILADINFWFMLIFAWYAQDSSSKCSITQYLVQLGLPNVMLI